LSVPNMTAEERVREHIRICTDRFKAEYGRCVRPLFHEDYDRNRPAPFGSCVLFRIGDEHFILSAAHVLDWLSTDVVYVGNGTEMIQLESGQLFTSKIPAGGGRKDDRIDIGVFPLTKSVWSQISGDDFLEIADIDVNEFAEDPQRFYIGLGFPIEGALYGESEPYLRFPGISTTGKSKPDKFEELKEFSPRTHILVEYDHDWMAVGDTYGVPPKLEGMSGGALFRFDSVTKPGAKDFLVGILIEQRSDQRIIVATQMSFIVEAIRRGFPETDPLLPRSQRIKINSQIEPKPEN